jgi:23S rRNA A2030 N6-methylase RlmJ
MSIKRTKSVLVFEEPPKDYYKLRQQMEANKRILIVDDDPYNLLGLKILLP